VCSARALVVVVSWWAVALGAAGCVGGGDSPDVDRYEASGDVPGLGTIKASDVGLVGLTDFNNNQRDAAVVSHDRGRTWRAADLPDQPPELMLIRSPYGLLADGDLMAVLGRDPTSASPILPVAKSQFLLWTTIDGDRWEAHVIDTSGGVVGEPTLVAVGPVLVASTSTSVGFDVFTSNDRGASWQRAEVTGLDQAPFEGLTTVDASAAGNRLQMVVASITSSDDRRQVLTSHDGGGSWSATPCERDCLEPVQPGVPEVQDGQVTTDGGATWHEILVDPPPRGDEGPYLSTPAEVTGGWLASASSSDVGDVSYGMLLRSNDGRLWRQMLPDPCAAGRPNSDVSVPFRFQDRWYVTYGCADLMSPESAVLYDGGTDARSFEPVEGTERDNVTFGDPIHDGDRVLLPEFNDDQLVGFTAIG
jgi:BNR/Asp-box repeat